MSDKLQTIPHTYDPKDWPAKRETPDGPYTFYSILGWSERKNPIGLLKAYLSEFSADDDVLLRLKLTGFSAEDVAALATATGIPTEELPAVEVVTDYLDHDGVVKLHQDSHCFVTAARAEGWNLPAFEAAIMGKPVISPDFGGQLDFLLTYCNAFLVGAQLTPAITPPQAAAPVDVGAGVQVRPIKSVQPSGINAKQQWGEPDLHALQKAMRACYEERVPTNLSDRERFDRTYGYDTIGGLFLEHLNTKGS